MQTREDKQFCCGMSRDPTTEVTTAYTQLARVGTQEVKLARTPNYPQKPIFFSSCGGSPFSSDSISGLYPLDTSSTFPCSAVVTMKNVSRHCLMLLREQNRPYLRSPALAGHTHARGQTIFQPFCIYVGLCNTPGVRKSGQLNLQTRTQSLLTTPDIICWSEQVIPTRILVVSYLIPGLLDPFSQQ